MSGEYLNQHAGTHDMLRACSTLRSPPMLHGSRQAAGGELSGIYVSATQGEAANGPALY